MSRSEVLMETLDRFKELGPELHIIIHYNVPLGWYGSATWCDEKADADVNANVPWTDDWRNESLENFLNELYHQALAVKHGLGKNA